MYSAFIVLISTKFLSGDLLFDKKTGKRKTLDDKITQSKLANFMEDICRTKPSEIESKIVEIMAEDLNVVKSITTLEDLTNYKSFLTKPPLLISNE